MRTPCDVRYFDGDILDFTDRLGGQIYRPNFRYPIVMTLVNIHLEVNSIQLVLSGEGSL